MQSALIIDDEPDARGVLKELLGLFCPQVKKTVEASNSAKALDLATQHEFDMAFIDIQLRQESGLELAQRLITYCRNLIFVTAYDNYAVEAYQTEAIHYLLKPINPHLLQQAVERTTATNTVIAKEDRLILPTKNGAIVLDQHEITHVEGDGNYSTFYTIDGKKYLVSKHLAYYVDLLNADLFFRIHQSYLVNLSVVRQYLVEDGYFVVLKNAQRLPIARRRKDEFLQIIHG